MICLFDPNDPSVCHVELVRQGEPPNDLGPYVDIARRHGCFVQVFYYPEGWRIEFRGAPDGDLAQGIMEALRSESLV